MATRARRQCRGDGHAHVRARGRVDRLLPPLDKNAEPFRWIRSFWDVCGEPRITELPMYWTNESAITKSWCGRSVWLHPPDDADIGRWVAKASRGEAEICVAILPKRIEAPWWRQYILHNPLAEIVPEPVSEEGRAKSRTMMVIFKRAAE
jgi:hypothetical protein